MVHHTGKSGTIIRGSTAWVQNVDASYEMRRSGKNFYTTLIPHKMKDAAVGPEINFELKEVNLTGKNYPIIDGKSTLLTTLVTEKVDEIPVDTQRRKTDGTTVLILKCLEENGVATSKKKIEEYIKDQGQAIDSIRVSLTRMVNSGEIIRVKQGVYELPPLCK